MGLRVFPIPPRPRRRLVDCFPHQQTEDDDDHEDDQVISASPPIVLVLDFVAATRLGYDPATPELPQLLSVYLPTRITCPSGLGDPPAFSTLIANAAADSTGVTVSKLVRIKPSFGTVRTPALTGWVILGSITHSW